ncbi:hypothetical protein ANO14919_128970 [Xylariales sp. No.14919]|nr:hypothetical protein ANO14919_128970 [Xylariales sp. No.14919]
MPISRNNFTPYIVYISDISKRPQAYVLTNSRHYPPASSFLLLSAPPEMSPY